MPYHKALLLLLLPLYFSCNTRTSKAEHSFYYWKSSYDWGTDWDHDKPQWPDSMKKVLGVQHFYLHYFDVDWSENLSMPVPEAEFNIYSDIDKLLKDCNYTPVVFITNRTFEHMPDSSCEWLAKRVAAKINAFSDKIEAYIIYSKTLHIYSRLPSPTYLQRDSIQKVITAARKGFITEIQIDCDWTANTRDKYFHFLKALRLHYPDKVLSATIRLYPYKYPKKMGVPPVDRGMLMCYNLGNIKDANTNNSVFDLKTLQQYFNGPSYPLQLDIAFPVFGWYAWFRGNEFKGIVHDEPSLMDDTITFTRLDTHRYRVMTDTVQGNYYYRSGDILRREYPDSNMLSKAIELVKEKVPNYHRIAFYHWNQSSIETYEKVIQKTFATR
ncbi:hypothetical protein [Chitinophaga ginsengisoli]|uniref:Glycosyl hydrolase family 18 (Putative chitinase) n=1 Tax=Chitinophaga ginsengisoli TaxID=363837 RepID=A0A2P8FL42_9BACT|nr:hypothetical protein [Chitinophaga ginsengisoli]PSL22431.1 hypothetical protein CLV42_12257 [Chitinophaga ginsengisoli]